MFASLGVDFLIVETFYWMDDALAAVESAKATGLPVIATVSFKEKETMDDRTPPTEVARQLQAAGADVVGINCMREPSRVLPLMRQFRAAVEGPLAAQPLGFRCWPEYTHLHRVPDWTLRVLSPSDMAGYAREAAAMGIHYIGSCCGSGPDQVRAMAAAPSGGAGGGGGGPVHVPTPAEAWTMITAGNAEALGFEGMGRLEHGAAADLLVLRAPIPVDEHLAGRLIYTWRDEYVTHAVLNGRLIETATLR